MVFGSTEIAKGLLGTTLVFQKGGQPQPVEPTPNHACLTFRSTGSNTLSLTITGTLTPTFYYSTDGTTWAQWDYSALSISAGHPVFLYGSNSSGLGVDADNYIQFAIGGADLVSCSGSIATLINGTDTLATVPSYYCFYRLFYQCAKLTSAPSLPSTTLKGNCYRQMFSGCSALTAAPALPAMTVATSSYRAMFANCTSLTEAPNLPATTINTYCYYQMFSGCSGLTSIPASLPATTLKSNCYYEMFRGCSKITTAPVLPATDLVTNCYYRMFYSAAKLNYVKAMFTTTPGSYTTNWLYGVASTGTFVKNSAATWTNTGAGSVPTGWTIQTASS